MKVSVLSSRCQYFGMFNVIFINFIIFFISTFLDLKTKMKYLLCLLVVLTLSAVALGAANPRPQWGREGGYGGGYGGYGGYGGGSYGGYGGYGGSYGGYGGGGYEGSWGRR